MVDVAQDTYPPEHFVLARETHERKLDAKDPSQTELEHCQTVNRLSRALEPSLNADPRTSNSNEPSTLVQLLVALTRDRMQVSHTKGKSKLMLDMKNILDNEPFLCGLCLLTTLEPTTIYCGHTFCRKCVDKCCLDTCIVCGTNPEVPAGFQPNVLLANSMLRLFPQLEELMKLKKQANALFAQQNYKEAVQLYTTIIELCKCYHVTP